MSASALPTISFELEKYFKISREIESALNDQILKCKQYEEEVLKLSEQNASLKARLKQYVSGWQKAVEVSQRANEVLRRTPEAKTSLFELRESLEAEKKRNQLLEERLKRERTEKVDALARLHKVEAELVRSSEKLKGLQNIRQETMSHRVNVGGQNGSFELKIKD